MAEWLHIFVHSAFGRPFYGFNPDHESKNEHPFEQFARERAL
jgi:hypothetical protein